MTRATPDLPSWVDETAKAAELARMKFRATGLLLGVTVIYFATEFSGNEAIWLGFIKSGAEAAMVGAIADWFAVTALFRHPMGLKIPHTAIIPHKKNQFGDRLGGFIQQNFLTGDIIVEKLAPLQISRRIAEWLTIPENSRIVGNLVRAGFQGLLEVVKDEDVQTMIEKGVLSRIRKTQVAPIMGSLLDTATSGPKQRELLIGLVKLLIYLVEENREAIQRKIIDETPWWMPWDVDDKVYARILTSLEQLDSELVEDGEHPIQEKFEETIQAFIERLKYSPEVIQKAEQLKGELLDHPALQEFSSRLWQELKTALLKDHGPVAENPDSPIDKGIAHIGERLLQDEELRVKIDGWVEEVTRYIMNSYGNEISGLISHTVKQWDPDATSRKIELQVGRDLQYIRINGTIVGGLVGLLIHTISYLIH